jgi:hypothetical protein
MRRIINSTYVSIDGVIENPHEWPPDLLFREGPTTELELVEATPLASGIVILTYNL